VASNSIVTILGRKGSGKTTLVREIVREHRRVVILDYIGEYGADCGARVVAGFSASIHALVAASRERAFRLSLRMLDEETLAALPVAWELEDYLLVVEEASAYCSPSQLPPEIARIVKFGRHQRISQVYVAQRPSMLHRHVTSQSDLIVSFHQHEPIDVRYLSAIAGEEAKCVQELGDYEIYAAGNLEHAPLAVLARLEQAPPKKVLAPDPPPGVDSGAESGTDAEPPPT